MACRRRVRASTSLTAERREEPALGAEPLLAVVPEAETVRPLSACGANGSRMMPLAPAIRAPTRPIRLRIHTFAHGIYDDDGDLFHSTLLHMIFSISFSDDLYR